MSCCKSITVLVVDDEEEMRELVATVLQDYTVLTAGNVPEARSILATQPVAVVITDLSMPGGSGLQLVREIRTHHVQTSTILMSAQPDVAHQAEICGAERWFLKSAAPITVLCTVVTELLVTLGARHRSLMDR